MARIESGVEFDKEENHKKLTKRMENMETTQYTVRIPVALYKEVRIKLIKEGTKLQPVIIDMLKEYIKK